MRIFFYVGSSAFTATSLDTFTIVPIDVGVIVNHTNSKISQCPTAVGEILMVSVLAMPVKTQEGPRELAAGCIQM